MQLQFFRSVNTCKFDDFSIVLEFYFGITNTESGKSMFIYQLVESLRSESMIYPYAIPLCHFAQSPKVTQAVISSLSVLGSVDLSNEISYSYDIMFDEPSTAHDCAAMIYVLANVQGKSKIAFKFKDADITEKQIKMLTNILSDKRGELQVTYLNLDHNDLTDECVSDLFSRASAAFSNSLIVLSMSGNDIGVDSIKSIAALEERSSGLSMVDLSYSPLGVSGLQALGSLISSGSLAHLVDLTLQDTDSNGEVIGPFLEILSTNCTQLRALDISDNNVQDDYKSIMFGLSILGSSRESNKLNIGLKRLNVDDNGLSVFVESLGNLTSSYCSFDSVDLKGNSICAVGILNLARAKNITVETLSLTDNPLGIQGVQAIGALLRSNEFRQLHTLKLSRCQLTSLPSTESDSINLEAINSVHVRQQLCAIPQNNTIKVLYLDGNSFTEQGIHILAGFMQLCSCVIHLSTRECGITSDDLEQHFNWLSQCKISYKSLGLWNLAYNDVDDKGAHLLIEHMPLLFPQIPMLFTQCNKISEHAMVELTRKLQSKNLMIKEPISYPTVGAVNDSQPSSNIKLGDTENADVSSHCSYSINPPTSLQESTPITVNESPSQQCSARKKPKVVTYLTVVDLAKVQNKVWEGRAKWYNIGLELDLTVGTLDAIQQTNKYVIEDCFRAMLTEWLRTELPTWSSLAKALRAKPVGLEQLAEQLPVKP